MTSPSPDTLWDLEYRQGGIPSSVRETPSSVVLFFERWLQESGNANALRDILDIGCGRGRNSLHLARQGYRLCSVDCSTEALSALEANRGDLPITLLQMDLAQPWPLPDSAFDAALDIFCFKHLIASETRANYRQHLLRTLRPGAFYLMHLADVADGYYSLHRTGEIDGLVKVTDPGNGIDSLLYTKGQIVDFFGPAMELIQYQYREGNSVMHGQEWERKMHLFLFRKR